MSDLKYGRLHVKSEDGLACNTEVWVETEDGEKIGLPATHITLWAEKQSLWTAELTTLLVRVDLGTRLGPIEARTTTRYEFRADLPNWTEKEVQPDESRPGEGEAVQEG